MKQMISIILSIVLLAVMILVIPFSAIAEMKVTQIQTGKKGTSLRDVPAGDKIGSIHQFMYLDVLDEQEGWFFVCHNGQYGWVSATMVTISKIDNNTQDYNRQVVQDTGSYTVTRNGMYNANPYDMGIPYIGDTVYREDSMNMVVFWVQTQLKATGVWYQGYQWDVTGHLGDHTVQEIRSFMQACGFNNQTGVVNQTVINALKEYLGNRIEPVMVGGFYEAMSKIMTGGSSGSMNRIDSNLRVNIPRVANGARWIQVILKSLGYYSGNIDGMYGEKTENAVKQFQRDHGFQERDYVTLGVARAMLEQYYYLGYSVEDLP